VEGAVTAAEAGDALDEALVVEALEAMTARGGRGWTATALRPRHEDSAHNCGISTARAGDR